MTTELHSIRHTLAHLLAAAVNEHYPDAIPTIGPAIDNGFYYDFDNLTIGDKDLSKIEQTMRDSLALWTAWERNEVSADEARTHFAKNPYKLELIDELAREGSTITLYTCGGFTDLCRGGHSENPARDIDPASFKLDRVAGAYWRGDEHNTMLTRVYGLAFETPEKLKAYEEGRELAKERDHKKLGRELDLFLFSDLVGPGLPLFTPKGTLLRDLLDGFVWELRSQKGYQRVDIAHLTKKDLYERSGHWDKFGDELFKIQTREGHEFVVKPMNCPHHTQIFDRKKHSYREMPQRYANTTKVYRDEQTGELAGLTRVRSITQDDAHVFCRYEQVKDEMGAIWDIIDTFYGAFGFTLTPTLSLHDPKEPDKYLGDESVWLKAENRLRELAADRGVVVEECVGEAAFYGPKIDFLATDALDRTHQVATIQLDMNMPERFDLTCINETGAEERIVMIHAAIMGSVERFMGPLIEHFGGAFPTWLSPVQVTVLPIAEAHRDYAHELEKQLRAANIRTELDYSNNGLGKKIRNWKMSKTPYAIVIGDNEVSDTTVTLEHRSGTKETLSLEALLKKLTEEIETRALN